MRDVWVGVCNTHTSHMVETAPEQFLVGGRQGHLCCIFPRRCRSSISRLCRWLVVVVVFAASLVGTLGMMVGASVGFLKNFAVKWNMVVTPYQSVR